MNAKEALETAKNCTMLEDNWNLHWESEYKWMIDKIKESASCGQTYYSLYYGYLKEKNYKRFNQLFIDQGYRIRGNHIYWGTPFHIKVLNKLKQLWNTLRSENI